MLRADTETLSRDTDQPRGRLRRIAEAVLAIILLVLLSPLVGIISLAILALDGKPILYRQIRVGHMGRCFTILKFRTMVLQADAFGSSVTTGRDPRITQIGGVLRYTKLDELPQLWNVLRGDMSLVGPRPDVPEIVAHYTPEMCRILTVPPGMTSIASLRLRDEQELLSGAENPELAYEQVVVPAKVSLAMEHVDRDSLWFDFGILIKTGWSLTLGRLMRERDDAFVVNLRQEIAQLNRAQSTDEGGQVQ